MRKRWLGAGLRMTGKGEKQTFPNLGQNVSVSQPREENNGNIFSKELICGRYVSGFKIHFFSLPHLIYLYFPAYPCSSVLLPSLLPPVLLPLWILLNILLALVCFILISKIFYILTN